MSRCYTFYSYKGGSGRSTTCVNTVQHLIRTLKADKDHPILIVDADLESAGLTYFFNCDKVFVDDFNDTVHTTKIFKSSSSALPKTGAKKKMIFKNEGLTLSFDDPKTLEMICGMDKYFAENIDHLFSDVELFKEEWNVFGEIVYSCCAQGEEYEKIKKQYGGGLTALLVSLIDTDKENGANKGEEKTKSMRAFLPAVGFVDVSDYFNCEQGAVRFLGVDVHYEGEQIVRDSSVTVSISRLVKLSKEQGYAAVVFDSGAGTQSSAEAFHQISDVLVYCMRPTKQFRDGTKIHLVNQEENLTERVKCVKDRRVESYRPVVVLPTAVPMLDENASKLVLAKREESLQDIQNLVERFKHIVDGSFCSTETALNEVALFKWEELILKEEKDCCGEEDLKKAYDTYKRLAEKLTEFSNEVDAEN